MINFYFYLLFIKEKKYVKHYNLIISIEFVIVWLNSDQIEYISIKKMKHYISKKYKIEFKKKTTNWA